MIKILVSEPEGYSPKALAIYAKLGEVHAERLDDAALRRALFDVHVLVVRLRKISRDLIEAAPKLQVIASPTTGVNHLDLQAAEERGIKVVSLKGKRELLDKIYATSEHTIALTLALLRRLPAAHAHVLHGGWDRQKFIGSEVSGKTVGIVGCGRLGSRVADIVHVMGARVIAADPHQPKERIPEFVEMVSLAELLSRADIISVHVSLSEETTRLIGAKEFALMKPGSFLINTSRGEVIDEAALLVALESGKLAGAALDVMDSEDGSGAHLVKSKLRDYAASHDNLILTPHIGGATRESMAITEEFIAEEVVNFLNKKI